MDNTRARWTWGAVTAGALTLALTVPGGPVSAAGASAHTSGHAKDRSHSRYVQTNLVSDDPGEAQITDPNLVNAWGASFGPGSPLWVSDNGKDVSSLYTGGIHGGMQNIVGLVVNIPGGAPTGRLQPDLRLRDPRPDGSSAPARFFFVGESGHLTGWARPFRPT